MPALHSIRMERFARFYMESGNAAASYLRAGYKASNRNNLDSAASHLSRSTKVKARIRELQGHIVARNRITVDSLIEELDEARLDARRLDQPSAAITATMSKARLTGLLVERKESGAPGEFAAMETTEQVLARVREELGDATADALAASLGQQDTAPAAAEELVEVEATDITPGPGTLQ